MVVGDVMLDRYCTGPVSRISPEAPVPVVRVGEVSDRPGGAGNVALNIASLGAAASLWGEAGRDEAGEALGTLLGAAGVECHLALRDDRATPVKLRVVSRRQQLLRLDFEDATPAAGGMDWRAAARALPGCGALVLSDYARGALAGPEPLIAAARDAGVPVLVDPKGADFTRWRGAGLLTPNLAEFEAVVGPCDGEAALAAKGAALIKDLALGALLITRGEAGMTLLRPGVEPLHLPARSREVFDVTGAGDTVIAVVAAALAAGVELAAAASLANIAAGIAVGRFGTAAVSAPELLRAAAGERGGERGVVGLEQLRRALDEARGRGEKIVFTNGCFDILHAGHVGYLEEARSLGDRLVVAVNGDDSVRRLKGSGRPVNPLDRRMAVLAALESVDWVVAFDADTPEDLLRALRPEVLVKGGDYPGREAVVGREIVEAYGGEVRLTGEIASPSTSAIVRHIRGSSKG